MPRGAGKAGEFGVGADDGGAASGACAANGDRGAARGSCGGEHLCESDAVWAARGFCEVSAAGGEGPGDVPGGGSGSGVSSVGGENVSRAGGGGRGAGFSDRR